MAKIYERSLSTIIAQGKFRDSFDPRSQTLLGQESTWKGDRLEITWVAEFFLFITRFTCIGCFTSDVLFYQASVKIKFLTLLVHHILGEFYRTMPCLLFTVFVTYFLEIREEA